MFGDTAGIIPQTVLTVGVLTVLVEGPMDPATRRSRCGAADFIDFYNTNSMSPSKTPQFLKKLMELLHRTVCFTVLRASYLRHSAVEWSLAAV